MRVVVSLALVLASGISVAGETLQPKTGTISGTVVSRAKPLAGALVVVRLAGDTRPASTVSGPDGTFVLRNLPPGILTVTASKPGFVSMAYGAVAPSRPGKPVVLSAGGQLSNLDITLFWGGVITGAIRSPTGTPVPDIEVVPLAVSRNGRAVSVPELPQVLTDSSGQYRVFGLPPGDFLLAAVPRPVGTGAVAIMSTAETERVLRGLSSPRGANVVEAAVQRYGLAPVYFPGTPSVADAAKITLGLSEERPGADFSIDVVPTGSIDGVVLTPSGLTLSPIQLGLFVDGPILPISLGSLAAGNPTANPDGKFTFSGVPPGHYTIVAKATDGSNRQLYWGLAHIRMHGTDVTGISLQLRSALQVTGRVVFEGTAARPTLDQVRMSLTPVPSGRVSSLLGTRQFADTVVANVKADWTFQVTNLVPGLYDFNLIVGEPWVPRSAVFRNRDMLDAHAELTDSEVIDLRVTVSDRHSVLQGVLEGDVNSSMPSIVVAVYPVDLSLLNSPRRVRAVPTSADGSFVFRGLPAGEYRLVALTDVDLDILRDPEVVKTLLPVSVAATIPDDRTIVTRNIRIARTR